MEEASPYNSFGHGAARGLDSSNANLKDIYASFNYRFNLSDGKAAPPFALPLQELMTIHTYPLAITTTDGPSSGY